jgi:hypothetical protein
MADQLHGVWLKLDRAKAHVDALRAEITEANEGDPTTIRLARQFDEHRQAIVFYVERLPEIRDSYGVLVGDAMHNFRCVLDHLWWQLARSHLGREPTENEAKKIQFPIISDPCKWDGHRFLKHVSTDAADKAKALQSFTGTKPNPDAVHGLEVVARLSDIDKHRVIHLAVVFAERVTFPRNVAQSILRDCIPRLVRPGLTNEGNVRLYRSAETGPVSLGDEIFDVPITPTGPNPDVNLEASASGFIAFEDALDVLASLEDIGVRLAEILRTFEPLL